MKPKIKLLASLLPQPSDRMSHCKSPVSAGLSINQGASGWFPKQVSCGMALSAGLLLSLAGVHTVQAGGWYVGNTAASETVRYKQVWLSAGTYRFTARAGATAAASAIRLEINNTAVQSGVAVPNTGRSDRFSYVHLGSKTLTEGYYDLKIVFETANVSLDWFMLSKDTDTSPTFKAADIAMLRPSTAGMLVAPITAFSPKTTTTGLASALTGQPSNDANGQPFSDEQLKSWYAIPMYKDYDRRTDRYWDILVDDLLTSRAQVPIVHCRETKDFDHGLQDRNYKEGSGAFEGRWLYKLTEAVARNPQAAAALKIGMFWENGGIADTFQKRYGYYPGWGDPALVDFVMDYWLSPWFDCVPQSMLYMHEGVGPIISVYASNPERIVKDGKMGDFITAVRARLQEKYGWKCYFIMPVGGDVDNETLKQGWAQAPWMAWNGPLLETNAFNGQVWGTTMVGSRQRIDQIYLNDWNPVTNTGTYVPGGAGDDAFQSRLDPTGKSQLINSLNLAKSMGIKLVQQEGFTNTAEGNSIIRSYHPGWTYPNQHLSAMRQFADPTSQTIKLEAEACDDYTKLVNDGNSGGSYRQQWYQDVNLDVYRPLSNTLNWGSKTTGPGNLTKISAGVYDVWALGTDGKIWAQPIMGAPDAWKSVNGPSGGLTSISVSKEYVWGLNGTSVYSTKIPYSEDYWTHRGWTARTGAMVSLSSGTTTVWATNASGQVFKRPADGSGDWTMVAGTIDKIYAGDEFLWGIRGTNIYYTRTSSISWALVSNPNNLTNLAVGSEEVWGVNAAGQVYRRSASGIGNWDAVTGPTGGLTSLSVGDGFVWGLNGSNPTMMRLEGYEDTALMAPFEPRIMAEPGKVTVYWSAATSATGYNVKRGTSASGPFTTITSNVTPVTGGNSYVDTTVANGTTYYYVISALKQTSESVNSKSTIAIPEAAAPTSPNNLSSLIQGNQLTLNWADNALNEIGFRVERKKGSGNFVPIAVLGKNVKTYSESVILGPDYSYRVSAYNSAGHSSYSSESKVVTSGSRLNRAGWVATASTTSGGSPMNVLDGNASTRWGTGGAQTPGQYFQLDMAAPQFVSQIDLEIGGGDYPRGYELRTSLDGVNWSSPVASGVGSSGITTISVPTPIKARYLKITQTGTTTGTWWSFNEINIYGQPAKDLDRTGWIYSASVSGATSPPTNAGDSNISTRWTTGVVQANGQWFTVDLGSANLLTEINLDAGSSGNDYPRGYQVHVSNDGTNWGTPIVTGAGTSAVTAIPLNSITARYIRITQTGSSPGNYWSIHEIKVAGAPMQQLARTGWSASASVTGSGASASYAIDGLPNTRWGTGGAQVNGQWFQVDMGGLRSISQVVMDAVSSSNDYPRGYLLFVSQDGSNWGNAIASGAGSLTNTTLTFPQQIARYIRVVQTGMTTGTWWSIHEIYAYDVPVSLPATPGSLSATGGDGEMTLSWAVIPNATSYTIKRATTASGPFTVVAANVIGNTFDDQTITNGTPYYYVVSAVNNAGESSNSGSATGTGGALPSPWVNQNIGSIGGNANYVNPAYTVAGSGADIWGTADGFRYVYQTASGDCSIVARVTSQQNTHGSAKTGIMLRETSATNSINASVMVSPGGVSFQWRSATGGPTSSSSGGGVNLGTAPVWIRLTRTGSSISAFRSPDGSAWTQIGTAQTVTMGSSALLGLATSSHDVTVTSKSTFDNVVAVP